MHYYLYTIIHMHYEQTCILMEFSQQCSRVVEKIVSDLMMQVHVTVLHVTTVRIQRIRGYAGVIYYSGFTLLGKRNRILFCSVTFFHLKNVWFILNIPIYQVFISFCIICWNFNLKRGIK